MARCHRVSGSPSRSSPSSSSSHWSSDQFYRRRQVSLRPAPETVEIEAPTKVDKSGGYTAKSGISFTQSSAPATVERPTAPVPPRLDTTGLPGVGDDAAIPRDSLKRPISQVRLPEPPVIDDRSPATPDRLPDVPPAEEVSTEIVVPARRRRRRRLRTWSPSHPRPGDWNACAGGWPSRRTHLGAACWGCWAVGTSTRTPGKRSRTPCWWLIWPDDHHFGGRTPSIGDGGRQRPQRGPGPRCAAPGPHPGANPAFDRSIRALPHDNKPSVLLVVGVNGTGKTTTVGKLARVLVADGRRVVLGAADTFRAAAADQLQVWAARVGAEVVRGPEGADPASVAYDASTGASSPAPTCRHRHRRAIAHQDRPDGRVGQGQARDGEAGRRGRRGAAGARRDHGQNGLTQARVFADVVDITGVVLTKLDGTAKGGIVFGVQQELGVPVKLVGLGEGPDDLAPFEPAAFVDALLG